MVRQTNISSIPEWITESFNKKCVISNGGWQPDDIKILNVDVSYAVPLGENFMSVIYGLRISYSMAVYDDKVFEKSFIIKSQLEYEGIADLEREGQIFAREMDMYERLLPSLQYQLDLAGIYDNLGCRCFHIGHSPDILVFEDLKKQGYRTLDKYQGLTVDHCKLTLERLALLHAASMKYYENTGGQPTQTYYYKPMGTRNKYLDEMFHTSIPSRFSKAIKFLKTQPNMEKAVTFMNSYKEDAYEYTIDAFKCKPGNIFNAQIHGDLWNMNTMYNYDDAGNLYDVIMIDYQFSNYASVANDFLYFFFTSANNEVRLKHFTTLVECYHKTLVSTLDKIDYQGRIPTLKELHEELKRALGIVMFVLVCTLGNQMGQHDKHENQSETETEEKIKNGYTLDEISDIVDNTYDNPEFLELIHVSMKGLSDAGLLD